MGLFGTLKKAPGRAIPRKNKRARKAYSRGVRQGKRIQRSRRTGPVAAARNRGGGRIARSQQRRRPESEQRRNARTIDSEGRKLRASQKQRRAALATAIVESGLKNVKHGDRDSLGLFQQRPSQGWGSEKQVTNPRYSARKFFEGAKKEDKPGLSPGELAQAVQKSGYPDRYGKAMPKADRLFRSLRRR